MSGFGFASDLQLAPFLLGLLFCLWVGFVLCWIDVEFVLVLFLHGLVL